MTNRQFKNLIIVICLISSAVLGAAALIYYAEYNLKFLFKLFVVFFVLFLFSLLAVLIYIFSNGGFKATFLKERILDYLEQNLISIGASFESEDNKIHYLPKIIIDQDKKEIRIKIDNLKIRRAIANYKEGFNSALYGSLVVENSFFDDLGNYFIIKYQNGEAEQEKYINLEEYIKHIQKQKEFCFELDSEHNIDLIDYPHWCILGSTGSGKTYLTQLLIIQFVLKGFEVSVFDVKKSYSAFNSVVDLYATDPGQIIEELEKTAFEMRNRQASLSEALKKDPRALAINCGYKPKIIFIEEYIGLKTLLNKEENKKMENIIKEISVLARSVNISLFIIAQSASVDIIEASIKNNLNKIFMGYLAPNIAVSSFGTGAEIPEFPVYKKGFGYVQLDRIERIKVPFVNYSFNDLELIKNKEI